MGCTQHHYDLTLSAVERSKISLANLRAVSKLTHGEIKTDRMLLEAGRVCPDVSYLGILKVDGDVKSEREPSRSVRLE